MPSNDDESRKREALIPSAWRKFYEASRVPAAVRAGGVLHVTGHTGERLDGVFSEDVEEQVRGTFRNIALTLAEAGLDWSDVVELNSYHVGLQDQAEVLLAVAAEFLQDPFPAWTAVGVTELIDPEAVIEISCVAVFP
jgi:enamine deaminase RidA (YjgF/YER057c/UK114 family)